MDPIVMASINMGMAVFLQCLKDKKAKDAIRDIAFKSYVSILTAFPEFGAPEGTVAPGAPRPKKK